MCYKPDNYKSYRHGSNGALAPMAHGLPAAPLGKRRPRLLAGRRVW